ncbi:hypothetical protein AB0L25_21745 [Spirillospora sp. NPDC052242]
MPLPSGWTIERVRAVSGCARAAILTAEAVAALDVRESGAAPRRPSPRTRSTS